MSTQRRTASSRYGCYQSIRRDLSPYIPCYGYQMLDQSQCLSTRHLEGSKRSFRSLMHTDEEQIDLSSPTNTIEETVEREELRFDLIEPQIIEQYAREFNKTWMHHSIFQIPKYLLLK